MTFTVISGAGMTTDGNTETVDVEIVEIRPQVDLQVGAVLPNGLDGLRAAVPALEGLRWTPERVFEDGDYVIAHRRVSGWIPDGDAAIVDIFRFENGRIVEHWDVVQPYVEAKETTSGNPMV